MRHYGPAEIRESIDLLDLSTTLTDAFVGLSRGSAANSPRLVLPTTGRNGIGAMLAASPADGLVGGKIVAVHPGNGERNPHQGLVVLFDPRTGEPRATFDAATITALRTVALSLAATRILANPDASTLAVFGTGDQAYLHATELPKVRPIRRIAVHGRDPGRTEAFARRVRAAIAPGIDLAVAAEAGVAARAEIVALCTASESPYLRAGDLLPGAHVNAIGACRPGMRELAFSPHDGFRVFVDDPDRAREEAAELAGFAVEGIPPPTPIGRAFASAAAGRRDRSEITLFKSVGVGLQDLVAAATVSRAERVGTPPGTRGAR